MYTVQHVDYSTVYIPTIDAWTTVRGHGLHVDSETTVKIFTDFLGYLCDLYSRL